MKPYPDFSNEQLQRELTSAWELTGSAIHPDLPKDGLGALLKAVALCGNDQYQSLIDEALTRGDPHLTRLARLVEKGQNRLLDQAQLEPDGEGGGHLEFMPGT